MLVVYLLARSDMPRFLIGDRVFVGCACTQCSEGRTYSNAIISPNLEASKIMPVPQTTPVADCTSACCDLYSCDLAWWFEGRCYLVSCPHEENCEPRKMGSIRSYLTFVLRPAQRPAQLLDSGELMLNRGSPSGIWGDSPEDIRKDLAFLGKDRGLEEMSEYSHGELEQSLFRPIGKQEPRGSSGYTDWGLPARGKGGSNSSAGGSPATSAEKQQEGPEHRELNESAWTPAPKPSPGGRFLLPLVTTPPSGKELEKETLQLQEQSSNSSGKEVGVAGVCRRGWEGLSSLSEPGPH